MGITTTITLPAHWASAVINGDTSGLESEDLLLFHSWEKENQIQGYQNIVDVSEPYFSHDIGDGSGLAGDVADYTVLI